MADMKNFESRIKVGRYLCWLFYRGELHQHFWSGEAEKIEELFERVSKMDSHWAGLLAGAYRSGAVWEKKKPQQLGRVVHMGELYGWQSIDGNGPVREQELWLYMRVGELFARLFGSD
jgi:hypothetical protein